MLKEKIKGSGGKYDYYPSEPEWWELKAKYKMRVATINQTMGPHWKDIYWSPHTKKINKRPYVLIEK